MEAEILKDLPSEYVVKYINSFQPDPKKFIIIMEYCKYGDLQFQISSMKKLNKKYQEEEIMFWFVQLLLGLKDIHNSKILHRDIKPENVFITDNLKPMIGDFGVSRINNSETQAKKEQAGTIHYMAPEVLDKSYMCFQSDVWSMGVILYELCAFQHPFRGEMKEQIMMSILNTEPDPLPKICSPDMNDLVTKLLTKNHNDRPDVPTIFKIPFVKGMLKKLRDKKLSKP